MKLEKVIESNRSALSIDRINIMRCERTGLPKNMSGIFFVLATWSAPAIKSFQILCDALALVPKTELSITVVDADALDNDSFQRFFNDLPQGRGEAYWIKDGKVIFNDHGYTNANKVMLLKKIQEFG